MRSVPFGTRIRSPRGLVLATVAACVLLSAAALSAAAAPAAVDPSPTATATIGTKPVRNATQRLEKQFHQQQKALAALEKHLSGSTNRQSKLQERIDALKAKGKDRSTLEAALAGYSGAVTSAQGSYNTAKVALDAHAGFDASGKVVDATQAKTTLETAGKALRAARQTLHQALLDLGKANKQFRAANKPVKEKPKQQDVELS